MNGRKVLVTGGTGYMGSRLIPLLTARGFEVGAVVRKGSEAKVPPHCRAIVADALNSATWDFAAKEFDVLVHLIGTPHPSPAKAQQFVEVDLKSVGEAVSAAKKAQIRHFVYVSVAHPAPAMKAYIEVRTQGEALIREAGLNATILRPWYVLGPGHWWPVALLPFYKLAELFPPATAGARRLGLVSIQQMLAALVHAVENPASGCRIVEVPEIRKRVLRAGLG
jgi:nucleoside-diphosphate-sugar epimerase